MNQVKWKIRKFGAKKVLAKNIKKDEARNRLIKHLNRLKVYGVIRVKGDKWYTPNGVYFVRPMKS